MGMKAFKYGLSLAIVMAFLAGCASTTETEEPPTAMPEDSGTTGTVDDSSVSGGDAMEEQEVELETVFYFDFDESLLRPDARAALTAHAERLKSNPRSVRLEGHADERGTREYNMALGERRANAVRDFLVAHGVSSNQIETVSYGEEYPAMVGSYESAWEKNRRVELK